MSITSSTRQSVKAMPWNIMIDGFEIVATAKNNDIHFCLNGEPIWRFLADRGKWNSYYSQEYERYLLITLRNYFDMSRADLHELVVTRENHIQGKIENGIWIKSSESDPLDLMDILLAADRRIALWRLDRLLLVTNCSVTRRIIGFRYDQKTQAHNLHRGG